MGSHALPKALPADGANFCTSMPAGHRVRRVPEHAEEQNQAVAHMTEKYQQELAAGRS